MKKKSGGKVMSLDSNTETIQNSEGKTLRIQIDLRDPSFAFVALLV